MGFSPVKNVRISSLTVGAVVQLRFGKAAVKSDSDKIVEAKLLRHDGEGDKAIAVFSVAGGDGSENISVSRFPGASWKHDAKYVSLVSVDESTHTVVRPNTVSTDVIDQAIELINKEAEDVFGAEQLAALLSLIKDGKRVNTDIKAQANRLSVKLVSELSSLPNPEAVAKDDAS